MGSTVSHSGAALKGTDTVPGAVPVGGKLPIGGKVVIGAAVLSAGGRVERTGVVAIDNDVAMGERVVACGAGAARVTEA